MPMSLANAALSFAILSGSAGESGTPPADAPVRPAAAADSSPPLTLVGVVTDQTRTVAGQEFYKQFCMFWHDKPHSGMVGLAVRERLSARRGNAVVIEFAGRVVFQGPLAQARAEIGPFAQQAADIAYEAVVHAEVQRLLFSNDELAPDEF